MRETRITVGLMLLAVPAAAQAPIALTIENIQTRNRGAFDVALSPDGRWAAVTAAGQAGTGIYLVPTEDRHAVTVFVGAGSSPDWFPDGRRLVFVRGNDLWAVAVGSTAATRLTNDQADERAPKVSPDGSTIAFYSGRSGFQDLWAVPAAGGPVRQLTDSAIALDDPRFAPAWSPDGRRLAYISNRGDYWADNVWAVDVATREARQLSHGLMATTTPSWSPDGKTVALLGVSKRGYWYEDLSDIWLVDADGGNERTVSMQVFGSDWLHSLRVYWAGDRLVFPYLERGAMNLWSVSAGGGVATRVTNLGGSLRTFDVRSNGALALVRSDHTTGSDVYLVEPEGGPPRRITAFAERWAGLQVPEEISYRSFDGLFIQGFLYRPPGFRADRKYPALVNVHGGGTNSYLQGQNLMEQYFASKGYVVLAINYRGGSGFGREFQNLSINDWASGQARDAAAAGTFLRSMPWSNGRVGIYGYSYGGIMSMATIARAPDVFDAAVPMAGIYDFGDAYTNADRLGRIFIRTGHGGSPEERPETYAVSNTLARIRNVKTPLLIMHGEADVRAPFHQFQLAVDTLRAYHKVFESKTFPGEPHGFRNPANRIELCRRAEAFLDRYLKRGRPTA
jgi:dipeptidyl aminopeptidase/acylaminoacyl peptidase